MRSFRMKSRLRGRQLRGHLEKQRRKLRLLRRREWLHLRMLGRELRPRLRNLSWQKLRPKLKLRSKIKLS